MLSVYGVLVVLLLLLMLPWGLEAQSLCRITWPAMTPDSIGTGPLRRHVYKREPLQTTFRYIATGLATEPGVNVPCGTARSVWWVHASTDTTPPASLSETTVMNQFRATLTPPPVSQPRKER